MKDTIIKKYNIDYANSKVFYHNDTLKFKIDGCNVKKTDEGYLIGEAPVAKVGVMTYLMADGTVVREFVSEECLFDKDSMDSLKMKPMTDDHPYDRRVTADNAGYRTIGATGETVKRDGDYLVSSLVIMDGSCVSKVLEDGKQELSPGYRTEVVMQSGTWNGVQYDAVQLSRVYNHLALVDNARGGTDIRLNLDKVDGIEVNSKTIKKENSMKFNIDGIDYEAAPEVVNFITKLQTKADAAEKTVSEKSKEVDGLKAEKDVLVSKVDTLEKRDIKGEVAIAVKDRLALERTVVDSIGEVEKIDELDNRALKVKVIAAKSPTVAEKIKADTSDAYVDSAFDIIIDSLKGSNIDAQRAVVAGKIDSKETKVDARQKMIDDMKKNYENGGK